MAGGRTGRGASLATLDIAWMAAAVAAVVAPLLGLVFGLYWLLRTAPGHDRFGQPATMHPTLGLGTVVLAFGIMLGVVAGVLALDLHSRVAPQLRAQRLAAARALEQE